MAITATMTQKKVLVAESDAAVAKTIVELLSRQHYEVILARDGREALQKALAQTPDAILLDNTLPGIGEIHICTMLKKNKATRDIPVAFLTGDEPPRNGTAAEQTHALMLIPKAFKPQQLLSSVGLLLAARRRKAAAG